MLGRMRERLTYGNVMATVALFVGLGGTSYALTLPKKSVGSRELKIPGLPEARCVIVLTSA